MTAQFPRGMGSRVSYFRGKMHWIAGFKLALVLLVSITIYSSYTLFRRSNKNVDFFFLLRSAGEEVGAGAGAGATLFKHQKKYVHAARSNTVFSGATTRFWRRI